MLHATHQPFPATGLRSRLPWLLLGFAVAGALAILLVFVDTLQQSVRRGEALREAQRSTYAPQRTPKPAMDNNLLAPRNYAAASQ